MLLQFLKEIGIYMEYIQNLSDSEIKLFLMIVSIFLSLTTLLLIIRNRIVDHKKSLEITIEFPLSFKNEDISLDYGVRMLSINILNIGSIPIFIQNPLIKYPRLIQGEGDHMYLLHRDGTDKFPYKLEVGELYKRQENLKYFLSKLKDNFISSEKIQIIVKDSLGKRYKSKKILIESLENELLKSNSVKVK